MSSDLTNSPLCREYEDGHQDLKVNFEKSKAAAAAARRHYRGLTWLGRARRAGGAPAWNLMPVIFDH